ncbi:hypothetical protein AB4099_32465 [Bosea sp. 2KB_26]|uniref:hypothetical protein n=1 Tax=Bosea sp. 2KB_26 TaxID=3237475 RepID=UPI003F8F883A
MIHERHHAQRGRGLRRTFILGRSADGSWIVSEVGGFVAATFLNLGEAIRFAQAERGGRVGIVVPP